MNISCYMKGLSVLLVSFLFSQSISERLIEEFPNKMIGVKSISIIGYDYFTTQELLDDPEFKEFMGDIKINEDSSYLEIEEIYDRKGNLSNRKNYNIQFDLLTNTTYEYDSDNRLMIVDLSNSWGEINKFKYTYNQNDSITQKVSYNNDQIVSQSTHIYDLNKNNKVKSISIEGELYIESIYSYYSEIPLMEVSFQDESGLPVENWLGIFSTSYTYDNRNNVIKMVSYDLNNDVFWDQSYTYDFYNNMTNHKWDTIETYYKYDSNNNVIEINSTEDGILFTKRKFKYNSKNHLIEELKFEIDKEINNELLSKKIQYSYKYY